MAGAGCRTSLCDTCLGLSRAAEADRVLAMPAFKSPFTFERMIHVRPHPGRDGLHLTPRLRPQPQERENRPHDLLQAFAHRRSTATDRSIERGNPCGKMTGRFAAPPLLGERAGVRADLRNCIFKLSLAC